MLFKRKHISEYPIYHQLTPEERIAIDFCERTLGKKCPRNYIKFLNKNLKKAKEKKWPVQHKHLKDFL